MSSAGLILIFVIVASCLGVGMVLYTIYKVRKDAETCVWAEFTTPAQTSYTKLCTVDGKEVVAPKGHSLPRYYLDTGKTYTALYPPGRPKFMQVTIRKVYYHEGNPEPVDPKRLPIVVTPEMIAAIKDEKFTEVAVRFSRELHELMEKLEAVINPKLTYALLVIICILAGVGLYFGWQALQSLRYIRMAFGLG